MKGKTEIDLERCKGCSLCIEFCLQHILEIDTKNLNAKGYHSVIMLDENQDKCTGCSICALMCPDVCIKVFREGKKE